MTSQNRPRFHHYLFAHRVLPQYAFLPDVDIFHVLEEQKELFLKKIWALSAEYVDLRECLPFYGFKIYFVKTRPFMGAVIVLPEPKNITEAHMVLFVSRMDRKQPSMVRYFTLEFGKDRKNTILCELTGGQYVVYGTGPSVNIRKFWEATLGIIKADVISTVSSVK